MKKHQVYIDYDVEYPDYHRYEGLSGRITRVVDEPPTDRDVRRIIAEEEPEAVSGTAEWVSTEVSPWWWPF